MRFQAVLLEVTSVGSLPLRCVPAQRVSLCLTRLDRPRFAWLRQPLHLQLVLSDERLDFRIASQQRRLKLERGEFFHAVYRVQEKLGRVYRELKPYSLFPLDEYFGGTVRTSLPGKNRKVLDMPATPKRGNRLDPPLRKVASVEATNPCT